MALLSIASQVFAGALAEHLKVTRALEFQLELLEAIAKVMTQSIEVKHKILWCGNGGSAGDCQHLSAELVGRFRRQRAGLASVALTTDTSVLTAIANDFGYEHVFARQVEALGMPGDVLVGMSTSGNSENVCIALKTARKMGLATVTMTGQHGGRMRSLADHAFCVNSADTARIQEVHILAGHMLCDWIELAITSASGSSNGALAND